MNGKDIFLGLRYVDSALISEAEFGAFPAADIQPEPRRVRFRRPLLIAAILALTALLVGCAAWFWSVQNLKIAEKHEESVTFVNGNGELSTIPEKDYTVLTLHGMEGTPAYLAHQEWLTFLESYDTDGVIRSSSDNKPMQIPEAYDAYSVYSQEMMDKVDEISQKYDLKLLGVQAHFQRDESQYFHHATGIDSLLLPDAAIRVDSTVGWFCEGGNFAAHTTMTMPEGEGSWPYPMYNSIFYSKTDYFGTMEFSFDTLKDWEQWNYTTKSGDDLLILQNEDIVNSTVFYLREDAIICASITTSERSNYNAETQTYETVIHMTKDQLKEVLDQLDFSIRVDSVDMELAKANLQEFENQRQSDNGYTPWLQPDYASFIAAHLAGEGSDRYKAEQYALYDLNDDGTDELLLGNNDRIFEIVYMVNGKAEMVHDGADGSNGQYAYQYYNVLGGGLVCSLLESDFVTLFSVYGAVDHEGGKAEKDILTLRHLQTGDPEYPWSIQYGSPGYFEPITEEEYNKIRDDYEENIIQIPMYPIEDFPSN